MSAGAKPLSAYRRRLKRRGVVPERSGPRRDPQRRWARAAKRLGEKPMPSNLPPEPSTPGARAKARANVEPVVDGFTGLRSGRPATRIARFPQGAAG